MNKKAFTLIELLSIIVLLAIIALITTPVILNIIENTKFGAFKSSAYGILRSAEMRYTIANIKGEDLLSRIDVLGKDSNGNDILEYSGDKPDSGIVVFNSVGKSALAIKKDGLCAKKDYEEKEITVIEVGIEGICTIDENGNLIVSEDLTEEEETIPDSNPGIICGNKAQEDYDNETECHIKSVEDLVEFTYLVSNGKTFVGKTVYLDKNLDIKNDKSYENANALLSFDMNGDEKIESIKKEMTTGKGFLPIGKSFNDNKYFGGTFEGNAYTISNLMINRSSDDNIGLFGYIMGSSSQRAQVKGLNLENISVKGNNYVGGIVGALNTNSSINEVTLKGNIEGTSYVGGIAGQSSSGDTTGVIVNANVTGTGNYVGGIAGKGSGEIGIVESGTIKGSDYVYFVSNSTSNRSYVNKNVIIDSEGSNSSLVAEKGEVKIYEDYNGYKNLNLYDNYIDTWLAGDNDNSGYYFDYDTAGKVVLKSTERNPIDTTLDGSGTQDKPYLIYTASDMKKIAAMPEETNYYKLMNDIDYTNELYYIIGIYKTYGDKKTSYNSYFKGIFEGNAYTIKNVKIYGGDYAGLFGYIMGSSSQRAQVKGLNLENISVKGKSYVGGIAGFINSNSSINEIALKGNIEGTSYVGGIAGQSSSGDTTGVIVNANVTGTGNYVGGISSTGGSPKGIVESGTIKGSDYVYGGTKSANTCAVNAKVKIEAEKTNTAIGGTSFEEQYYNNFEYYSKLKISNSYVIETAESTDVNKNGYYFGYNSAIDDIVVVKVPSN